MLSKVSSLFKKTKTAEDYQTKIDDYTKQLEELEPEDPNRDEIEQKITAAGEKLENAQQKEATKKVEKAAYDKTLADLAKKKADRAVKDAEAKKQAEDYAAEQEEEHKIKVIGGFFVYRAKPSTESKRIQDILSSQTDGNKGSERKFAQQGEITGMVLIKQSGDRKFMTYSPIDPKTYTVDKFMEYFKDTMYNNKYDDNIEKVFELETLGTLINKLIIQTVEEEAAVAPSSDDSKKQEENVEEKVEENVMGNIEF